MENTAQTQRTNWTIQTAERLKDLREGKKLSHVRLSECMEEQKLCSVGKDSLMNYERTTNPKYQLGMSAEKLRGLAVYYGVSTDWLLGLSKFTDKSNEFVLAKDLGLTESSISLLTKCIQENNPDVLDGINSLLSDVIFYFLAGDVGRLKQLAKSILNTIEDTPISEGNADRFLIDAMGIGIVDDIDEITETGFLKISPFDALNYLNEKMVDHFKKLIHKTTGYKDVEQTYMNAALSYSKNSVQEED